MIVNHSLGQLGRLGNQLFQVAATLSHAKRVGEEAVFNPWPYRNYFERKITCRTDLGCMIINGIPHEMVHQPQIHYVPIPENKNLILIGWFQSYKYINEELIKEYFQPCNELIQKIEQATKKFPLNYYHITNIAIHVRRTDFVTPSKDMTPNYHNVLGMDYYKDALMCLLCSMDRVKSKTNVTIFSDDIPWCRQEFPKLNLPVNFYYSEGNSDIVDMYLMASHNHQIIANSSFSWWGAWLNRVIYAYSDHRKNQVVIAPKQWFGPAGIAEHDNTEDIYCPGWVIM